MEETERDDEIGFKGQSESKDTAFSALVNNSKMQDFTDE